MSKRISIITTEPVDKDYYGEPVFLLRTITSVIKDAVKNEKRFITLTQRCKFVKLEQPLLNEDGTPQLDADNNPLTEEVEVLQIIDKKDNENVTTYSFKQINELHEAAIKFQIPDGLLKMESENLEEQLALLIVTQQDGAWGVPPDKWELY